MRKNRMIKISALFCALLLSIMQVASASDGLIATKSPHGVVSTADKLESILESKGMTVFGRVDHAAGADSVELALRPTQVLIFGNPKIGTPLMNCSQSIAIDLPQKMLVWEDAEGEVWLGYNDPEYLKARHDTQGCDDVFAKVSGALAAFAKAAVAP